jgi:hypothetical protein
MYDDITYHGWMANLLEEKFTLHFMGSVRHSDL